MKLSDFPEMVIAHYNLCEKATPYGLFYVVIKWGMYEIPQSVILSQTLLETRLNAHGYHQSNTTPGMWTHEWRPICFTLAVDDFGVKHVGKEYADHLIWCIKENYDIIEDWEGKHYLGITFDWNYDTCSVHLSTPNYIPDTLKRFKRENPKIWQGYPHQHTVPNYGAKQQFTEAEPNEPVLGKETKKYIQQVLGTFLYYARAVDPTMLVALSAIASEQT